MWTWILVTLFLGLLLLASRKPSSLPPGKWGLPLIGYIPIFTRDFYQMFQNFNKEYGDVFTWRMGSRIVVCFCDYNMIKTIFSKPECQGRPNAYIFQIGALQTNTGLFGSVGEVWHQGRRFALRHLRDFGFGKSSMDSVIQREAMVLVKSYEKTAGEPIDIGFDINVAALNVIWKLVADTRYDTDDEKILKFSQLMNANMEYMQGPVNLVDIFPSLQSILPNFILNNWMNMDKIENNVKLLREFLKDVIDEHIKTFDPASPRDYIDTYLTEIQNQKGNPDTIFKEDLKNLLTSISDLFGAGSESTAITMRWLIAQMAANPDVQRKMQEEIDRVIPKGAQPSLLDRDKMPYTEAVLMENHRCASIAALGVFHSTTEEIRIGDYVLPKNTILMAAAEVCHKSPKYWERPDEFYPEHFLDEQGKVNTKKEGYMPFSLGRRQCLGESLAKMELFMFATHLFQKFFAAPPKGQTIYAETDKTKQLFNFVNPYKVVFTKRE